MENDDSLTDTKQMHKNNAATKTVAMSAIRAQKSSQ